MPAMRLLWIAAAAAFAFGCAGAEAAPPGADAYAAPSEADRAQVEKMVYDFEDAWNRHDMTAFAALFHDDADWVHWRGGLWSGRQAIHDGHKAVHETYYATSHATVRGIEALHFLSPTVAYLRVRSDMTGDARFPGETFRYRRTMILSKRDGQWLIVKGHNTRIVGENDVDWTPQS
jgi:uncharacterized protein (TIGR02246 family)